MRGGHVDGSAPTVVGPTLEEATAGAAAPEGEVLLPLERPFKPSGALHALHGNLAPEGSLVKLAGTERTAHTGPARVLDSEEACTDAVRSGKVAANTDAVENWSMLSNTARSDPVASITARMSSICASRDSC